MIIVLLESMEPDLPIDKVPRLDELTKALADEDIDEETLTDDVEDTQSLNDNRALNDGLAIVVVGDRLCVRDERGEGLDEEDCHDVSDFNGEVLARREPVTE